MSSVRGYQLRSALALHAAQASYHTCMQPWRIGFGTPSASLHAWRMLHMALIVFRVRDRFAARNRKNDADRGEGRSVGGNYSAMRRELSMQCGGVLTRFPACALRLEGANEMRARGACEGIITLVVSRGG